jgi:hypothetical protein
MSMKKEKDYKVLRSCIYDENATRSYDIMRGGFIWSDEFPNNGKDHDMLMSSIGLLVEIIAYRASLTAGKSRIEFEEEWNTLKIACPSWPGFREERIYGKIERDYKAVEKKEERCFRSDDFLND